MDPDTGLARLEDERETATRMLAALTRDFTGIVEASAGSNADDEHDPEGATIAFERSQVTTMIEQARDRLVQIEAAVERVHDGTYGTCESCGRRIPDGRLEARPVARTCIACA
ncbi:MAG: TraR/DksA C4-type zinc finger protein [Aeromicrobium sp.]